MDSTCSPSDYHVTLQIIGSMIAIITNIFYENLSMFFQAHV